MKKVLSLLPLLPIYFLCLFPGLVSAQANFTVDAKNMGKFIKHIDCEYEDRIHVTSYEIQTFLNGLLSSNTGSSCGAPEPTITLNTPTTLRFDWPNVAGANTYNAASFGLEDGTSVSLNPVDSKVGFNGLSEQLYLFGFVSNCSSSSSFVNIIIVDKDLSLVPYYANDDDICQCDTRTSPQLKGKDQCGDSFESLFLPWNNNCDANRYHFAISEEGTDDEKEFYILSELVGEEYSIYVLKYCDPLLDFTEGNYTVWGGNYSAILTSDGINFYPEDEATGELEVTRTTCGCYTRPPGEVKPEKRNAGQNISDEELQVSPNPFNDVININLKTTSSLPTEILIFDLSGRLVQQSRQQSEIGSFNISTAFLDGGIYQLVLKNGQQSWQQKIVKIK